MENESTPAKLDIFRALGALNKKDGAFCSKISSDELKSMQPFVVMRWATGTSDASQVFLTNEFVNPYAFSLQNHKELLWKLLTVTNSGTMKKYNWIKAPSRKTSSKPMSVEVIQRMYHYSKSDAIDALTLLTVDDILDIAQEVGAQSDELSKITKQWKQKK